MKHNYASLSPIDFEYFCADLLGAELGLRFELFGEGADGGIDMRCNTHEGLVIGQAKRYTDISNLRRAVKKESRKLVALQPHRYFLLTSCSLSPSNKEELAKLLEPYCSTGHIYGRSDLDLALSRHPQVLRRHFKLWLHDAGQLSAVLHNDLFQLSAARFRQFKEDLGNFVVYPVVEQATSRLKQYHVCLITGAAGVGKSTLCGFLALKLAAEQQYEVHWLHDTSGVHAAFKLLQPGRKQCFILDDLLGANFLTTQDALALEQALLSLLNQAKQSNGRLKLLIASRDYVLQQARERLPKLAQWLGEQPASLLLECALLSLKTRADILFNHLYFGPLSQAHKEQLVVSGSCQKIVEHHHFNPRLLKSILQSGQHLPPRQLPSWLLEQLAAPEQYWECTFDHLSPEAQCLLYILALTAGELEEGDLNYAYAPLFKEINGRMPTAISLQQAIGELEPAMVISLQQANQVWVRFSNPGVADLVHHMLSQHSGMADAAINSLRFYEQASQLLILHNNHTLKLRSAQFACLVESMEQLIGEAMLKRIHDAPYVWQADAGIHIGHFWQCLQTSADIKKIKDYDILRNHVVERASVAPWRQWLTNGNYSILLDLATTVLPEDKQHAVFIYALHAMRTSEDALILARLYEATPFVQACLSPRLSELKNSIQKTCLEEITNSQDADHISAIMSDIEQLNDIMNLDMKAKYAGIDTLEAFWCGEQEHEVDFIESEQFTQQLDAHKKEKKYIESIFSRLTNT